MALTVCPSHSAPSAPRDASRIVSRHRPARLPRVRPGNNSSNSASNIPWNIWLSARSCLFSPNTLPPNDSHGASMPDDKRDDPAFLYFPSNYRWSMGLLICLSAAPWTGVEIDEVNRVGRALADRVGDDAAWFEEWARMGEKIEARGRDALRAGHKLTAASCFMRATRYYQTGERFIHPRSQRSMDVYARSVTLFKDAAAVIRRPRIEPVEVPYENTSLPALLVHPDREATGARSAPAMIFFDGFDVTKELQYGYGIPDLAARGVGCLIVDGPGNGESVRFRNLPLIAETENYATPAYDYLAARGRAGAALCLLRRLGGAMGLSRDLGAPLGRARFWQGLIAFGAARASAMGAGRFRPRRCAEKARSFPTRRHRAKDGLPVFTASRRWRRADSA